jgi:hypothetical protein
MKLKDQLDGETREERSSRGGIRMRCDMGDKNLMGEERDGEEVGRREARESLWYIVLTYIGWDKGDYYKGTCPVTQEKPVTQESARKIRARPQSLRCVPIPSIPPYSIVIRHIQCRARVILIPFHYWLPFSQHWP